MQSFRPFPPLVWRVYIVRCADSSLYTGVSVDLSKRVHQHNNTKKAAKYTRSRRPVVLVWSSEFLERSSALKLEYYIKKLSKKKKESLVAGNFNIDYDDVLPSP